MERERINLCLQSPDPRRTNHQTKESLDMKEKIISKEEESVDLLDVTLFPLNKTRVRVLFFPSPPTTATTWFELVTTPSMARPTTRFAFLRRPFVTTDLKDNVDDDYVDDDYVDNDDVDDDREEFDSSTVLTPFVISAFSTPETPPTTPLSPPNFMPILQVFLLSEGAKNAFTLSQDFLRGISYIFSSKSTRSINIVGIIFDREEMGRIKYGEVPLQRKKSNDI
ncbi:hypothetical protein V1478_003893 [Vespula squamosa]|uniref:Uncharacterized protein n=1 Tax=Vespula squamosa TaxID=30214 RepID=A0ABD2BN52_VESSQ